MNDIRLHPDARRGVIVKSAVTVALSDGIMAVDHDSVSSRAGVPTSAATVRRYFPTMMDLREAAAKADSDVMKEAKTLGLF